jgi:hypothetical protein
MPFEVIIEWRGFNIQDTSWNPFLEEYAWKRP